MTLDTLHGLDSGATELLKLLADRVSRTRAEIMMQTGASRSSVLTRIAALRRAGLVVDVGEAASTGGRPSAKVALNDAARTVGAIDIGSKHCSVAICDLGGQILSSRRFGIDLEDGPVAVLEQAATALEGLLNGPDQWASLVVLAAGVASPVDAAGVVNNVSPMPGWSSFPLGDWLRKRFMIDVLVDNDANLMAIGERALQYPKASNVMFLKAATGIGIGLVLAKEAFSGSHGFAGDIGHLRVYREGAEVPCHCGNVGCLVAVASADAILRELRTRGIEAGSVADLAALVTAGDVVTAQLLRRAGRDLGTVLASCVTLLNPSVLVVGGSLAFAGDHLIAGIREALYAQTLPHFTENLVIARTRAERDPGLAGAGARGAAWVLADDQLTRLLVEARSS